MKLSPADFPKLQLSLLAALLMIGLGAGSVHLALNATQAAKLARNAALAERNDFDGKLKRVRNEELEIKKKSALFITLQARGVIGEEQRLEWVELLKDIRDKRRLLDLQYEISPQRPLDAASGSGLTYYASTMRLQIKLLHEDDLIRLLNDLRQNARALLQVKSCNVARLPRGGSEPGMHANLQAECQIDWITAREAAKK